MCRREVREKDGCSAAIPILCSFLYAGESQFLYVKKRTAGGPYRVRRPIVVFLVTQLLLFFHNASIFHFDDAVAVMRVFRFVGDHDDSLATFIKFS